MTATKTYRVMIGADCSEHIDVDMDLTPAEADVIARLADEAWRTDRDEHSPEITIGLATPEVGDTVRCEDGGWFGTWTVVGVDGGNVTAVRGWNPTPDSPDRATAPADRFRVAWKASRNLLDPSDLEGAA